MRVGFALAYLALLIAATTVSDNKKPASRAAAPGAASSATSPPVTPQQPIPRACRCGEKPARPPDALPPGVKPLPGTATKASEPPPWRYVDPPALPQWPIRYRLGDKHL